MNRAVLSVVGVCFLLLAGCAGSKSGVTEQPEPAVPAGAANAPFTRQDAFSSILQPLDAAKQCGAVFENLHFQPHSSGGGGGGGLFGGTVGDHFSARTSASTFANETVVVTATWEAEDRTRVALESSLPPAQHDFVLRRIRSAVAAAATRPGGQ